MRGEAALADVDARWAHRTRGRRHELPAPLVVSVTSYPPRFATLAPTLKCLLTQSIAANRTVLWIAAADMARLPDEVIALCDHGLEIVPTEDLRSLKKIIPALKRFPGAFIATTDDDVCYGRRWLEGLVNAASASRGAREIACWRAHHIRLDATGAPLPYTTWRRDIRAGTPSPLVFPTGVGGVLYPPRSLHPEVLDTERFGSLCPNSDDIWLYWMARLNGSLFRKIGPRRGFVCWPGSQQVALQDANAVLGGGNDIQLGAMTRTYGNAWEEDFRSAPRYGPSRTPPQQARGAGSAAPAHIYPVGGAGRGRSLSL